MRNSDPALCWLSDRSGGTPTTKQPLNPEESVFEIKHFREDYKTTDLMVSVASFTREVTVEQIATPDLLVAEILNVMRL
ncbi:unnamed protein product [Hyaloperonospora brassicae]|uniref:Uncharacterized protein n=1 Tax=Hyaloperonospora brassicae TaxID=162125 RepID=A0AAV0UBN0_HYABA|nr:unnamed protein product [Hyaloperonospora brassicae]